LGLGRVGCVFRVRGKGKIPPYWSAPIGYNTPIAAKHRLDSGR